MSHDNVVGKNLTEGLFDSEMPGVSFKNIWDLCLFKTSNRKLGLESEAENHIGTCDSDFY